MEPILSEAQEEIVKNFGELKRITDIVITRSFSHKQMIARVGHVIYKFYWKVRTGAFKDGIEVVEKWSHVVQVTLAYEELVGEKGVKEYIKSKYILKSEVGMSIAEVKKEESTVAQNQRTILDEIAERKAESGVDNA